VLDGMRVTFAAQSTPRNDPLVCAAGSIYWERWRRKSGRVATAAF